MKNKYLCFHQNKKLQGSFLTQLRHVICASYQVRIEKRYGNDDYEIACVCVDDYMMNEGISKPIQWILKYKKHQFSKAYRGAQVFETTEKNELPKEVCLYCAGRFFEQTEIHKETAVGIIDGDVLSRKLWVQMIRKKLGELNSLLIVCDTPEYFSELISDAYTDYGLIVVVAKGLDELGFCDYVMDFSREDIHGKIVFRKPCTYFMGERNIKKVKKLRMANGRLKIVDCEEFAQMP